MIDIELYQPKKVNLSIPFPSEWNELSLQQLHIIAQNVLSNFETTAQAQTAMFLSLLKNACGRKVKDIEKRLDAEDTIINGYPAVEFLYKSNTLTKQPYPSFWLPFTSKSWLPLKVVGPQDDFNNLTCGEFEDAEIFYNEFKADPNHTSLANLAAVLYRSKGVKYIRYNFKKAEYIGYESEKYLARFLKMKPWKLYSIFLWYSGCREQLPKLFSECFEGASSGEPDFYVFTKCIHEGAGEKNGSRNEIRMMLLKEFFFELKLQAIKAKELKSAMENAK